MPTKAQIANAVYDEQQTQLKFFRPNATPWPDGPKLGLDDGAGYAFGKGEVRKFTSEIYKGLRKAAPYTGLKVPVAMPTDVFLDGNVVAHRRWISKDVAQQLGVA